MTELSRSEVSPYGAARKAAAVGRRLPRLPMLPYAFLAPALILILVVSAYPILFAVQRSFYATSYMQLGEFVGWQHYIDFFTRGGGWVSLRNSVVFTVGSVALALPFSFLLALILDRPLPFRTTIRTILILPWVVSQTVGALLWGWIMNPDFGPVSHLVGQWLGLRIAAFSDPSLAMGATILANVWQSYGLAFVLLLAALQTIPDELIEAGKLDGAGRWTSFRWIILPLVQPTLLITTIMLTLHSFNMVTLILVLTGGGPVQATETMSVRIFNEAFKFQNLGLASMIGVLIAILNIAFSIAYLRVLRREPIA